ncbi:Holliday junction branch migration protein RuvA [candidate division KSB1 bacterium]|nr:Holliday junction branch migration protein RuvA [candidate division KSB1 bacterium]
MISYIKGTITKKTPTWLVIDVNNVGFQVQVSVNCSREIGEKGSTITILTYLHVREDSLQLFGFISEEERDLFLYLISTSGIGPKKALAILSGSSVRDLQQYILEEDLAGLTSLSGIGRRTAQRLILELKDKLKPAAEPEPALPAVAPDKRQLSREAVMALISLGYNQAAAQNAIKSILDKESGQIGLEELITRALRKV